VGWLAVFFALLGLALMAALWWSQAAATGGLMGLWVRSGTDLGE
jgi:hypothetical protein